MSRFLIAVAFSLMLAGSCARVHPPVGPAPQPNPLPAVAADVDQRVKLMRDLTDQLIKLAAGLPAQDDNAQREALRSAFDLCARVLPLLMGPDADGQFRLQQRIVTDARDQLARAGDKLALEPTVDAGLRAVYNALVRISQESFYTSQSVSEEIAQLQTCVDALDTVRGPMHRDAAARAVEQSASLMDRMTRIYSARLDRRTPEAAKPNPKS